MSGILNEVYPDDLFYLQKEIRRRQIDKIMIDWRIANNPHTEEKAQREFAEELLNQRKDAYGVQISAAPIDTEALDELKNMLSKNGSNIAVK